MSVPAVAAVASSPARLAAPGRFSRSVTGIVVSAGLAQKTVKVRVGGEKWNNKVKKYFKKPEHHLVHDPNDSLRAGDIVEIASGWKTSKKKRFVVNRIIAPFGPPIHERPPVPTPEEREAEHAADRAKKLARRELRRQSSIVFKRFDKVEKNIGAITAAARELKLQDRSDGLRNDNGN